MGPPHLDKLQKHSSFQGAPSPPLPSQRFGPRGFPGAGLLRAREGVLMSSLVGCGDAREGQRVWGIAAGLTRKRPLALGKEPNTTKGWLEAHAAVNGRGGRRGERATSPAIGCGSCPSPRSATAPTGDHDQPLGAGPTTFLVSSQLGWSAVAHLRGAQGRSGRVSGPGGPAEFRVHRPPRRRADSLSAAAEGSRGASTESLDAKRS